ncbi:component of IIS longevity pathway SMK-1-domain-containing protein [Microdochium trichocladiopsis]|uniref:Component of IIS longevity pathway SMK-1-domain-containing protein n=1 Tax=Microdochium trichocladiopsis TaxID=1682393 RepID=A0A9P9BT49_9PEZI|nr:component of IIS longevity pathway SMK-1-domain-containing protein [Microdochium trichocladiopsis]KAH7035264.1 component of IIS longevity pathway SMK-1-domain-containing protein [Microdochium trichocladiopsis]
MAAQQVPHPSTDRKRVKVYELRHNDWFDRGTGFCTAEFDTMEDGSQREPRVIVESEEEPDRVLLETRICKEDGFHKQQETLIVWTEPSNGVDMALSFQESEGCALIWKFINSVQQGYHGGHGQDDSLSDELAMDMVNSISLPPASFPNLPEIESQMRIMSGSANGRDALTKFVISEDYISKLIPLVSEAEDLEALNDLHRLCNIMKIIILLNDTSIIERAVSDECVIGVVGALEYDPDFPSHKANHRQWLEGEGRFKEVVRIEDTTILTKIHQTYRLQYLKDVVLARILDDNTFSVLNSLIFFNQVDIVQHLQSNGSFLNELFSIFKSPAQQEPRRKKEAVLFIQQCCAIAKNLQPPSRQTLYNNFIAHGLLQVINFGLRHSDVSVRVGATDILVSMIDHDPQMIRMTIYRQMHEKQPPLTESLIDLLLVEVDLGVKSQISDALKVLLDQGPPMQPEAFAKSNGEFLPRTASRLPPGHDPQQERFLHIFFETSATRLFQPIMNLRDRTDMSFTVQQAAMFTCLVEILCFFVRQHPYRCRNLILRHDMIPRITQLLGAQEKFLKLVAIRFLRQLVVVPDEFYLQHLIKSNAIGALFDLLEALLPRDNLLTSACLEFFDVIRKDDMKTTSRIIVKAYAPRIEKLLFIETFQVYGVRFINKEGMDKPDEYWGASDDDDDVPLRSENGETPLAKPLVDYASDEDLDDNADAGALSADEDKAEGVDPREEGAKAASEGAAQPPLERLSEKRRREEDQEEDLSQLIQHKRRNSSSASSNASSTHSSTRKKKPGATNGRDGGGGGGGGGGPAQGATAKKISISIGLGAKNGGSGDSQEAAAVETDDKS